MNQYYGLIAVTVFGSLIFAFSLLLASTPVRKRPCPTLRVDEDSLDRLRDQLATDVREMRKRLRSVNGRINNVEQRLKRIEKSVKSRPDQSWQATWNAIDRNHAEIRSRIEKLEKDLQG